MTPARGFEPRRTRARTDATTAAPGRAVHAQSLGAKTLLLAQFWRYGTAMPSIQVKGVPDEVHSILRRRAAAAGQSLQEYLLSRLVQDAQTPTLDELLDRAGGRAGGRAGFEAAAGAVRAERDAR
jgi:antitoxin FitA